MSVVLKEGASLLPTAMNPIKAFNLAAMVTVLVIYLIELQQWKIVSTSKNNSYWWFVVGGVKFMNDLGTDAVRFSLSTMIGSFRVEMINFNRQLEHKWHTWKVGKRLKAVD